MDIEKVLEYKEKKAKAPKVFEQDYFELGICEVVLGNYHGARHLFEQALLRMFEENAWWRAASQPDWLVHNTVLSGRRDFYNSSYETLLLYRSNATKVRPVANAPLTLYCCSVMEMLDPHSENILEWVDNLLKRPKYKDLFTAGQTLQAILNSDEIAFNSSLSSLIKVHEGKAKHGELRWSPLGWLCLPAMALSYIAIQNSLAINIESPYLSIVYLQYISHLKSP